MRRFNGYRHQQIVAGASVVFWAFGPWLIHRWCATQHMKFRPPCPAALRGSVVGVCSRSAWRRGRIPNLAAHLPSSEASANSKVRSRWRCGRHLRCHAAHLAATIGRSGRSSHAIRAADDTHAIICRPPVVSATKFERRNQPMLAEIPPDNAISTATWPQSPVTAGRPRRRVR